MRLVVLVSGTGSNLQAILDAVKVGALDAQVVAVGSDRIGSGGIERAWAAGVETFVVNFKDFATRAEWDQALLEQVRSFEPDYVVSAGFMRIVAPSFIDAYPNRYINTHPALLPAFPGAHGVRDALAYGVKITGCTVHIADAGVDTGPILGQAAVAVHEGDTEESLHERIKAVEHDLLIDTLQKLTGGKLEVQGAADGMKICGGHPAAVFDLHDSGHPDTGVEGEGCACPPTLSPSRPDLPAEPLQ